jgi:hypothetical protein
MNIPSIVAKSKELDSQIQQLDILRKKLVDENFTLHKEIFYMKQSMNKVSDVLSHIKSHPSVAPMVETYEKYLPSVKKGWYVPVILVLVYLAIKKNSNTINK